ncbi:MAG: dehydrogenase [Odoribacter sp.]|nr:dehydrogenase [Odoribacter sp.]
MIIRSKAPLRLGLAGGGSDVSPYSNMFGGLVLNATINLYAYCTIEETNDGRIRLCATDLQQCEEYDSCEELPITGQLDLHKGVYNRIIRQFALTSPSFRMTTYSDAPPGSGLGSSSTMVVAILKAFVEWFNLPMGDYEIARMAYEIERLDLQFSGGKQDQYAAAFGGFNFMEFLQNDHVIVNPLRVKRWIVDELEANILLYYTGASRLSAKIIDEQRKNTSGGNQVAIEAMHNIKQSAVEMKDALLRGDIGRFADILGRAWEDKKRMASPITNACIDEAFRVAQEAGALTGKVSGAGGGGFIIFVVEPTKRLEVIRALSRLEGKVVDFQFSEGGTHGWKIYK